MLFAFKAENSEAIACCHSGLMMAASYKVGSTLGSMEWIWLTLQEMERVETVKANWQKEARVQEQTKYEQIFWDKRWT